jgi:hypothetical protein
MRSTVIIEKRGSGYYASASGKFGGGFSGTPVGTDPSSAAAFAARQMVSYAQSNNEGGDLVAPEEVMALVPKHLQHVDKSSDFR